MRKNRASIEPAAKSGTLHKLFHMGIAFAKTKEAIHIESPMISCYSDSMNILEYMKNGPLFADGGMGTMLQAAGLTGGRSPEQWNIENPDEVRNVHAAYVAAGANIVTSNTFGANRLRQRRSKHPIAELVTAALTIAREAASAADHPCFVALDIGPLGAFLAPLGTLTFDEAVELFSESIIAGAPLADCILIETMGDLSEAAAAVTAAKKNSTLPVFVTLSFDANSRLLSGATPEQAVTELAPLGIDGIGCNCGVGPEVMVQHLARLRACTDLPIFISPNAGLPRYENGKTVYDLSPAVFAERMQAVYDGGASVLGGCCGTTPEHIRAMTKLLKS